MPWQYGGFEISDIFNIFVQNKLKKTNDFISIQNHEQDEQNKIIENNKQIIENILKKIGVI